MKKLTKKELWTDIGIFACLITLCGLIMTGLSKYNVYQFDSEWIGYFSPLPSIITKSISVIIAINEFGGDPVYTTEFLNDTYQPAILMALCGIVFTFLLVPYIFIKALEALRSGKRNIVYYSGITLMIFVLGTNLIALPRALIVSSNTWESAAQSRQMDKARQHLADAAFLAAEDMILEYEWVGEGDSLSLDLSDIGNNLSPGLARLDDMDTDQFDVVINKDKSDTSLILHLVIQQDSKNASFQNINGESGLYELAVEIGQKERKFFNFRRDLGNY